MNIYTIYCTPEQTRKALELGAPLKSYTANGYVESGCAEIPTAEQMICWLEESLIGELRLEQNIHEEWGYIIYDNYCEEIDMTDYKYPSRKTATLAAIDAVLEYLCKNKEIE